MTGKRPIVLCYGTRPQIIKASVLAGALREIGRVTTVDTGQHYDFAMHELFYRQLSVQPSDHYLGVGSGSHAAQTAAILNQAESLLRTLRPDAVAVIGDTNSTLGCALGAAKLRIPVIHVEAGLRAQDRLMAEEINRRVTDAIAGLLCAPSHAAAERLRRERPDAQVCETGDVARDVLRAQLHKLPAPSSVDAAAGGHYIFATMHRAELVDQPELLRQALTAIASLPLPTILAVHPRTQRALDALGISAGGSGQLVLIPPVGYLESLALAQGASLVLTDSGGLQREAYWLGVPCITLRGETEWEETIAAGANRLLAPAKVGDELATLVTQALASRHPGWDRDAYGDGHAARQVAAAAQQWLQ